MGLINYTIYMQHEIQAAKLSRFKNEILFNYKSKHEYNIK